MAGWLGYFSWLFLRYYFKTSVIILLSLASLIKYLLLALQSAVIGVIAGILPRVGDEIAALYSYDRAKRISKNPSRPFGEGAYEGVIAPETANNVAIGGALIPMLTLGIPGDAVTAVIIGAFDDA